tara:strand:- start:35 stop:571 length:537 start_codon:yes stop_codon:yes gene_type:complete
MLTLIIQSFILFLPAGIANMAPVFFKKVRILDYPIDGNRKLFGKPILGKNKTYRGFILGIIFSMITVYLEMLLYPYISAYALVDYQTVNIFLLGFLLGFGALFGDLVASFFKRQLKIKPGETWLIFDQIDWILSAILFSLLIVDLSAPIIFVSILFFGSLHPLINLLGYVLRIKKNKF